MESKTTLFVVDDDSAVAAALRKLGEMIGIKAESFAFAQDFLHVNPTAERVTGMRREQLLGMKLLDLQRADKGRIVACVLLAAVIFAIDVLLLPLGVAGGVPYVAVVLISSWLPRRQHVLYCAVAVSVLPILGYFWSEPAGIPWMVLDNRFLALLVIWVTAIVIIDRKWAELELKSAKEKLELRVQERTRELTVANLELNDQINERERAENQARQHLTELAHFGRVSTIGEMASGISHELNQPLTAIALESEICVAKIRQGSAGSDERLLSRLEWINDQAHRAGEIIRLLKRFTRRAEPCLSTADVNELVRDMLQLTDSELQNHNIVTRLELGENLPEVLLDHVQIMQVLLNLVRNAVEAMQQSEPQARFLTIRTEAPADGTITISVSDTGAGIAAGDLERIFESFYTTKHSGTGLGLAISRSLIEAHGGRLWANPNATVGSTLTLRLPIGEKEPESGT